MRGRRPQRWIGGTALLTAALLVLAGCGSGGSSSATGGPSSGSTSTSSSGPPSSGAPGSDGSSAPTTSPTSAGSSDHPVVVRPTSDPLTWQSVPGPTRDVVTVGGDWTLTVSPGGDSARLDGPHPRTIRAAAHSSISDAFLDDAHALVVSEDDRARTPDVATLVDLGSGSATTLDRSSSPSTRSVGPGRSVPTPWPTPPPGRAAATAWCS